MFRIALRIVSSVRGQAFSTSFFALPRTQAPIEGPDHQIEAGRDDGAHIGDRAHLHPSAPDGSTPPQHAAVAIQ